MAGGPRTYGQQCGLAVSLDLLGERWTLLILRDLSRGPKRFKDLLDGLPGIGTNLLTARLRALEEAGVIEAVTLPPPASVPAYDLAARGRSLQPILEDLALWGLGLMDDPGQQPEAMVRAAWAAMVMRVTMEHSETRPPEGIYAFEVGDESFWLRISEDESALRDGPPPLVPDVKVEMSTEDFFQLATGSISLSDSGARTAGRKSRLESLFRTFRLPPDAVRSANRD